MNIVGHYLKSQKNMDFNKDIIVKLQKYSKLFTNATKEELLKGFEISKTIKEFDSPDDFLNERDLFLLSQYYSYQNIVDSIELSKAGDDDDYVFDDEDL